MTKRGIRPASSLSLGIDNPHVSRAVRQLEDRVNALVRRTRDEDSTGKESPDSVSAPSGSVVTSYIFKEEDSVFSLQVGDIPVKRALDSPAKLSFTLKAGFQYHFRYVILVSTLSSVRPVFLCTVFGPGVGDDLSPGADLDAGLLTNNWRLVQGSTEGVLSNGQVFDLNPDVLHADGIVRQISVDGVAVPTLDQQLRLSIDSTLTVCTVYRGSYVELHKHVL
jgi:hypothetical protein